MNYGIQVDLTGQVAIVTGVSALLSGFEAYYSHYKNNILDMLASRRGSENS